MSTRYVKCKIDGCDGNAHYTKHGAKGWCNRHWLRWRRHGDPLGGGTDQGARKAWVDSHLNYEGDDCLVWPYSFDAHGYCNIYVEGKLVYANRYICERANGPAPSPYHEAAHSCGNGGRGCLNKNHIRWATHAENMADRFKHGWDHRGGLHASAKLTNTQAREVFILAHSGEIRNAEIAMIYGIKQGTVSEIKMRRKYISATVDIAV